MAVAGIWRDVVPGVGEPTESVPSARRSDHGTALAAPPKRNRSAASRCPRDPRDPRENILGNLGSWKPGMLGFWESGILDAAPAPGPPLASMLACGFTALIRLPRRYARTVQPPESPVRLSQLSLKWQSTLHLPSPRKQNEMVGSGCIKSIMVMRRKSEPPTQNTIKVLWDWASASVRQTDTRNTVDLSLFLSLVSRAIYYN